MPAAAEELVGRERELALLRAALDDLGGDSGRVVEVVGEPGIGKSRLVAELSAFAEDRRKLVLPGRAAEFESDFPFGVVVDALDDYLGSLGERTCARLGEGVMEELGPKTIEGHLSRVFEKLSVSKRAAVAGAIERERAAAG